MPVPPGLIPIRRRFEGNPFQSQLVKWNEVESSGINRNQVDRFIKCIGFGHGCSDRDDFFIPPHIRKSNAMECSYLAI